MKAKISMFLTAMVLALLCAATTTLSSDNNVIEVIHYKVEVDPDYKLVGKVNTDEKQDQSGTTMKANSTTEHYLFSKSNDKGNIDSFVIVRIQRLSGKDGWIDPMLMYTEVKNAIYKGNTEVLGVQAMTVLLRVRQPNARYLEMMKAHGLTIDQSYPKLVCYIFGKRASSQVRLEILYYYGEKTEDDEKANANLKEISNIVKIKG